MRRTVEHSLCSLSGLDGGGYYGLGVKAAPWSELPKKLNGVALSLCFHSLRHGFASALANAGVSEEIRMKLTGHRSSDVHQKYTHMNTAPFKEAIDSLCALPKDNASPPR